MSQAFLERDFLAYERHRQDDPEYNGLRLSVRRKLKAIVDAVFDVHGRRIPNLGAR